MRLKLTYDTATPERSGAGGMYQIESVIDAETGDDLTDDVDVGLLFSDEDGGQLLKYLKEVFGPDTTIVEDDPEDDPDWPFK